jgi:N-methylhydantoinase A/oxoprolinase/acetone carboxylase beta subunit
MDDATQGSWVGVDIGGTFTDVVLRQPGRPIRILKLPTTRGDPSAAVIASIAHIAREWGVAPAAIERLVHGTTVATNAVIERKGARIGLIATAGFRDVLEIGRQMRHQMYDLSLLPETPIFLAPGRLRREVSERVAASGEVVTPLDEASALAAIDALAAQGVEAIAVCLLFSFVNPAHEQRIGELIAARHPHIMVSLSSEVDPAFREYERTVVTAFDAYIKPVIDRYLANLEAGLAASAVSAPLQIMQSRGGVAAATVARRRPVRLFLSGPAAGAIGARRVGTSAGFADIISVDVGGTSSDITLIADGEPGIRAEGTIEGYPVRVGMVDVNAIGAGGGSIAWLDAANGLRVGPHSAGSDPGPACYGRGGEEATVTDASMVLGYLDPAYFAGGSVRLQPELAHEVIRRRIAQPLGMSVERAALGIHRVVNAQMGEGIRLVSIRQGRDPRQFALLPLGGAGPLHATALAADLGIRTIVVPRHPGVLSADGLLGAPIEHEVARAFGRPLADLAMDEVAPVLAELDRDCAALMQHERTGGQQQQRRYSADVCYIGQSYYLEIPLEPSAPDALPRLYGDFTAAHDRVYGHATQAPARIVNLRSIHRVIPAGGEAAAAWQPSGERADKGKRRILIPEIDTPVDAHIYDRAALAADQAIDGPAIIEQPDTTTLVSSGWRARVDGAGNLVMTWSKSR